MTIRVYPREKQIRPGVTVTTNTDSLVGVAQDSDKKLMLVGMANGGQPGVPISITNFANAKSIFRGGDLLDAIEIALSPNASTSSGEIIAERVGQATQASFTNGGLTLTSKLYSSDANGIQTELQPNSLDAGTYNLGVYFTADNYQSVYTNIGKIFSITYTGDAAYASVSVAVDSTSKIATNLDLKTGADANSATVIKSFPLAQGQYAKVSSLISDINVIQGFTAQYYPYGNKNIQTAYLDETAEVQLSEDATKPTYINSLAGDIVNTLSLYDSEISASYDPSKGEPKAYTMTNFTGGTQSETSPASWSTEISNFSTVDGYYLVPLTDDEAIQAEALSFVEDRTTEDDPKVLIVGGDINEQASASINRASLLRTIDAKVVVNASSGTRLMNDGTQRDLPAYIIAAGMGGLASGLPIGEPITFKTLDLIDIDQKFTKSELDILDEAGVVAVEFVRNRAQQVFRITDDVTTANAMFDSDADKDPTLTELGTGEATDFLVVDLRSQLEDLYIGTRTSLVTAKDLKTTIISFLTSKETEGVIVDYSESNIAVSVDGETATINMSVQPVRSLKHINVSLNYTNTVITA